MFPREIATIVAEYAASMRFRPWVKPDMINQRYLLANPNAIGSEDAMLDIDSDKIKSMTSWDFNMLLRNPNPMIGEWISKNMYLVKFSYHVNYLAMNASSWAGEIFMTWVRELGDTISWISWEDLSANPAPWAVDMLKKYPDHIDDNTICANPSEFAIDYIKNDNVDVLNFHHLSANPHPWAVKFVGQGWRDERGSSSNPNPDLIDYIAASAIAGLTDKYLLATNPNIFEQRAEDIANIRNALISL